MSSGFTAKHIRLDYDNWYKSNPTYLYGYSLSDTVHPTFITEDQFYNYYFQAILLHHHICLFCIFQLCDFVLAQ